MSPPIFQTSLFTYDSYEAMEDVFAGRTRNYIYSRGDNPTVREFELLVARLEGAEDGRAFSSGTAAITSTILSLVEAGDRVVAVRHLYNDVYRLLVKLLARLGVAVDFVDPADHDEVRKALSGAKLLYLENPTSFVFELQDIAALSAMCIHGNPNILTRDVGTSQLAQGSTGQLTQVEVERFDGEPPRVRIFEEMRFIDDGGGASTKS